ncbi:hypothetical protein F4781DRAFT_438877 [Annulohypoxylon bovei var. microspora]|nr:hypothetical protein F4781DRAFT_438877 [Annulohypoxylon bovei var. microspora]
MAAIQVVSNLGESITNVLTNKIEHGAPKHEISMAPDNTEFAWRKHSTNLVTSEVSFDYLVYKCLRLSDFGETIVELFKLPAVVNLDGRTKHFIDGVAKFVSLELSELSEVDPGYFAWQFGEEIVNIAAQIPPRSSAQDVLVRTVASLYASEEKEKIQRWKSLEDLGMSMREAWNASPEPTPRNLRNFTNFEWINLNSFLAKLYSKEIIRWKNFPIWELRIGLETSLSPAVASGEPVADTRIRVVREWIGQSGHHLLRESLLSTLSDYPEKERGNRPYRGGPLYTGDSGFSLERWCFWKRRLKEIRTEVDEDLRLVIDETTEFMIQAEKKLGELAKLPTKPTVMKDEDGSESDGDQSECKDSVDDESHAESEHSVEPKSDIQYDDSTKHKSSHENQWEEVEYEDCSERDSHSKNGIEIGRHAEHEKSHETRGSPLVAS